MKLTVTTLSDTIVSLDVSDDMELENFKALCEFETQIPAQEQVVIWDGRPLHENKKKLKDYGLKDGEVLLVQHVTVPSRAPRTGANPLPGGMLNIDFSNIQIPGRGSASSSAGSSFDLRDNPAAIRDMLRASPEEVAILKERNPPLAEALLSGSLEKFTEVLRKQQQERAERERERIRLIAADPFDAEVQSQIAEEIRLKNVETNMETAMEYAPESFGQVLMLYIDVSVNGHEVKAFVDSGAQMTIMSKACADRCNIGRLVDTRWAGIAKGVGTQRIIGRVHLGQIKIGKDYLQSSFSILEDQPMDMLLGLDMLRRHQCSIDLKNNVLVIGTTGTMTPFLSESEVPEHARLNRNPSVGDMESDDHALAEALAKSSEEASASKAGGSSSGGQGQGSSGSSASSFPEASISRLTSYGFSRQQAIEELQRAQGNVDQALAALFAKSFHVP